MTFNTTDKRTGAGRREIIFTPMEDKESAIPPTNRYDFVAKDFRDLAHELGT